MLDAATIVQVLIETPLGVANADAIAAIDGVDMLALGANDLTAELGIPGQYDHPLVRDAVAAVADACRSARPAVHARRHRRPGRCMPISPSSAPARCCSPAWTPTCCTPPYRPGRTPCCEAAVMTTVPLETTPMRAAATNTLPTFDLPAGSCDAHFHVFEPGYPHVPNPLYTFPDGDPGPVPAHSPRCSASRAWCWCSRPSTAPTTG